MNNLNNVLNCCKNVSGSLLGIRIMFGIVDYNMKFFNCEIRLVVKLIIGFIVIFLRGSNVCKF